MREQQTKMTTISAIAPGTYSADVVGQTIDRAGFDALTFALQVGVGGITFNGTNFLDFTVEHSLDGVRWEAVSGFNIIPVIGGDNAVGPPYGRVLRLNTAHPALTVHRFGYVDSITGEGRFIRLNADFSGTHGTGTPLAALAILGHARELPVAA